MKVCPLAKVHFNVSKIDHRLQIIKTTNPKRNNMNYECRINQNIVNIGCVNHDMPSLIISLQ